MRAIIGIHEWHDVDGELHRHVARLKVGLKGSSLIDLTDTANPGSADTVAVAVSKCALRELSLPFADAKKALQVAPFEIDGQVPYDVDEAVVSAQVLALDDASTQVLVAVAPESAISERLGLPAGDDMPEQPQLILPEAVALWRFAQVIAADNEAPVILVDVRDERILLVAVDRGQWHGSRMVTTVQPLVQNGVDDLLAATLMRAMQSLGTPEQTPQAVIVGQVAGGTVPAELANDLAEVLGCERLLLEECKPGLTVLNGGKRSVVPGQAGLHAISLGLALSAADDKRHINLRAGAFAPARSADSDLIRWAVGAGIGLWIILALFWADGWIRHNAATEALAAQKAALIDQYRTVFTGRGKVVDPLRQAKNALSKAQSRGSLYGAGGTTPIGYLHAVSEAIPKSLVIDVSDFTVEGSKLRMEAQVASFDAINQVKGLLSKRPEFVEVQVSDAKMNAKGDRVKFRVRAVLAEGV